VVGGAAVVGGAVVVSGEVGPPVVVAVRVVGKLPTTLLTVLPHPAARQARTRVAANRKSLFAGCRMTNLPCCSPDQNIAVIIPPAGERRPHPLGSTLLASALPIAVKLGAGEELGAHLDRLDRAGRACLQGQPDREQYDAESE